MGHRTFTQKDIDAAVKRGIAAALKSEANPLESSSANSDTEPPQHNTMTTSHDALHTATVTLRQTLSNFVRAAVHAIRPFVKTATNKKKLSRFMYWDPTPEAKPDCAEMLIKRYERALQPHIDAAGGLTNMALAHKGIRTIANNERSIQAQGLRALYVSKTNEESQLCRRLITKEYKDSDPTDVPTLPDDIADTGVTTLTELRALINSPDMYSNPVVYHKWCTGLESGVLRSTSTTSPCTVSASITVAHEAHFRLEIYLALEKRNYRHPPGVDEAKNRKRKWIKLCKMVHLDRERNEEKAHAERMGKLYPNGIPEVDEDELGLDEADDIDHTYF